MEWKIWITWSYSVSDILDFKYIFKKLAIRLYVNQIENGITFRIKTGYYLALFTLETIKLLENTKCKITQSENGQKMSLKFTEVVLVHCNIVNNDYQYDSRVLYTFIIIIRLVSH